MGDLDVVVALFPNMLVRMGIDWDMYALPKRLVGLAVEVHLVAILVLYGRRQTLKRVSTLSARVETSAGQD